MNTLLLERRTRAIAGTERNEGVQGSVTQNRLASLDAYRGFVMMALAWEGFIPVLAQRFSDSTFWQILGRQFVHVQWEGWVFWDLIQPSFMFMVGVAIPYSYASRRAIGESAVKITAHVLFRSLILIALGIMLVSSSSQHTNFLFDEILCQIGLAYPFAYLLINAKPRTQVAVGALILLTYWFAFYIYPLPAANFDYSSVGINDLSGRFYGLYAHWNRNTNFAAAFDHWFLNLFPRSGPFPYDRLCPTLNFVPSIVTLLFGIMAGELLRRPGQQVEKLLKLTTAGVISFLLGVVLGETVCPIIKALWTPSWALVSGGFTFWFLAAFYWFADMRRWRGLMFPLTVVGTNSLAMYLMIRLIRDWLWKTVEIHGGNFSWSFHFATAPVIMWLICWWMYRRKLFLRI